MARSLLFMFLAVLTWGAVPLADKIVLRDGVDPLVAVFVRTLAATVAAAVALLVGQRMGLVASLSARQLGLLVFAGVSASVVGNWFYFHALRDLDAGLVVAATSTYPAVTLLLAWMLFGERPQRHQLVAFVLILSGLVLLNWPQPKPPDAALLTQPGRAE